LPYTVGICITVNKTYSEEFIERILKKLQSPANKKVAEVAREENISKNTIYGWIYTAREKINGVRKINSEL
jgi:transposase-like protein